MKVKSIQLFCFDKQRSMQMKLASNKQIKILKAMNEICNADVDLNDIITEERAKDLIDRNFGTFVDEIEKERK